MAQTGVGPLLTGLGAWRRRRRERERHVFIKNLKEHFGNGRKETSRGGGIAAAFHQDSVGKEERSTSDGVGQPHGPNGEKKRT